MAEKMCFFFFLVLRLRVRGRRRERSFSQVYTVSGDLRDLLLHPVHKPTFIHHPYFGYRPSLFIQLENQKDVAWDLHACRKEGIINLNKNNMSIFLFWRTKDEGLNNLTHSGRQDGVRSLPTMPRFKTSEWGLWIYCEQHALCATPQHPDGHHLDAAVVAAESLLLSDLLEDWAQVKDYSDDSFAKNDSSSRMAAWREHAHESL